LASFQKDGHQVKCTIISRPEELETAYSIRHTVFVEEQGVPADLERDSYDDGAVHFLALLDDEPVGTARLILNDDGSGKAGRVAVLKKARHSGIGRILMDELEQHASRLKLSGITLAAQCEAVPFYLKRGYVPFGEIFSDAGIAHQSMSLLPASETSGPD